MFDCHMTNWRMTCAKSASAWRIGWPCWEDLKRVSGEGANPLACTLKTRWRQGIKSQRTWSLRTWPSINWRVWLRRSTGAGEYARVQKYVFFPESGEWYNTMWKVHNTECKSNTAKGINGAEVKVLGTTKQPVTFTKFGVTVELNFCVLYGVIMSSMFLQHSELLVNIGKTVNIEYNRKDDIIEHDIMLIETNSESQQPININESVGMNDRMQIESLIWK